jgi:hypothetical protein
MSIHTRLATAVSAAVVAAALALPASAATSIPLNSGQEPAGGEAGGHGFFSYTIDGTEFCWTLSWQGIADPLAGHVHFARAGWQDRSSSTSTPMAWGARTHPAAV